MYQKRVRDALSPLTATAPDPVDEAMWALFLAIGDFWKLEDDTAGYRLRLRAFMANRVSLDPNYAGYYGIAARVIADLVATHGGAKAYEIVFTHTSRGGSATPPETDLATVQNPLKVRNGWVTMLAPTWPVSLPIPRGQSGLVDRPPAAVSGLR